MGTPGESGPAMLMGWAVKMLARCSSVAASGVIVTSAGNDSEGLIPVLEVSDLPASYQPFNPAFQGQLSGDDFTNWSTRQERKQVLGSLPGSGRKASRILHSGHSLR
jgi:hypothetical protein